MSQAISQTQIKISGFALTRPRLSPMLVVIVLMSLLSLLFVWTRIHAISLEYEVSRLERDLRVQTQQVNELSLEVAFLSRDERIEILARSELGLRDPVPGQIVRVE
ncbi:MAG: cell division protein FtsL [Desulfuromonadales bacterium]|nr:cell division protein FtsL [Desulfuromonadales bacterium]